MRRQFKMLPWALGALCFGVGGYFVGTARAAGIPATATLAYSGVIHDAQGPIDDPALPIGVSLWDVPMAGDPATNRRCDFPSMRTAVTNGRFRIVLPEACVAAVQANPELYVEISLQGDTLPRQKIGAVPYAVEAQRASSAGGALEARIARLEARQSPVRVVGVWAASPSTAAMTNGASTWTDIAGTSVSFTLTQTATVVAQYSLNVGFNTGITSGPASAYVLTRLTIDGSAAAEGQNHFHPYGAVGSDPNAGLSGTIMLRLGPGAHRVALQWNSAGGDPVSLVPGQGFSRTLLVTAYN